MSPSRWAPPKRLGINGVGGGWRASSSAETQVAKRSAFDYESDDAKRSYADAPLKRLGSRTRVLRTHTSVPVPHQCAYTGLSRTNSKRKAKTTVLQKLLKLNLPLSIDKRRWLSPKGSLWNSSYLQYSETPMRCSYCAEESEGTISFCQFQRC